VFAAGDRERVGGYREEKEETREERTARESASYQARNLPESMWTKSDPG
jgi:hypothetical protein